MVIRDELKYLPYHLIWVNAWLSIVLGILSLLAVLVSMVSLARLGFPPIWLAGYLLIPAILLVDGFLLRWLRYRTTIVPAYFSGTRALMLIAATAYIYRHAGDLGSSSVQPVLLIAWAIFVLVTMGFLYKVARSLLALIVLVVFSIGAIAVNCYILTMHTRVVSNETTKQQDDDQTTYDFQLMRQDIRHLISQNGGSFPEGDAREIAEQGAYGKEFSISERADKYTYIPLPAQRQFKLCATFNTDTMGDYPGTTEGSDNEGFHHSGYQCFTYRVR